MSDTHSFTFEVTVTIEAKAENDWGDRDPQDYAREALATADLGDACSLDGFADLTAQAWIADIHP